MTHVNDDAQFLGKYESSGRIGRWLIDRFFQAGRELLEPRIRPGANILEVGCGPGYSTQRIARWKPEANLIATDLSSSLLRKAANLNPGIPFTQESVLGLAHGDKTFDCVIMLEVLEHLEDPQAALLELQRVTNDYLLLSTPREPVWRMLNCVRGKYLGNFGNTPGHIQHWSTKQLIKEVATCFHVEAKATPVPWTILLLRPK